MKIAMVCLEDGIVATGFRKFAGFVSKINPDTKVYYVGTSEYWSISKSVFRNNQTRSIADMEADIECICSELAGADIVGFSSMTGYAEFTKRLSSRLRAVSRGTFQVWGGIHPIVCPEDAIDSSVDAICTGEGEFAFAEFLESYKSGRDFTKTKNFWFNLDGAVVRNPFRPLMSSSDLELLPFPKYGGEEYLFRGKQGFTLVTLADYLANNGLGYKTIWSIGCPLHCIYCSNTIFIANNPEYRKIRHPSPEYIVNEVRQAMLVHPHLTSIQFLDDSFMAIPLRDLAEFAVTWREQIRLPFAVYGVIPTYVQREKLDVLTWAGMNRIRMGIQSGSERMLEYYRRPTPVARVEQAASIISEFKRFHINPAYDLIVDNPVETRNDVIDTLELVYRMARPFTLNIFSLRSIPNTELEKRMREEGIDIEHISASFLGLRPTWANVLLYLMILWRPPRPWFDRFLRRVRAFSEPQPTYPLLIILIRIPYLIQQGFRHLRFGEFSEITGRAGYVLWKIGLISLLRRLRPEPPGTLIMKLMKARSGDHADANRFEP